MKRSNKKGFTIVELVIVIAIIAVLAAVLIPTFAGVIRKANVAKDTQLVSNLNKALATDTANEHVTMTDALAAAAAFGYDVPKINASATNNEILWDATNDLFCYYDADKAEITYIPEYEPENATKPENFWVISTNATNASGYSVYYTGTETEVAISSGFDAGTSAVNKVTYTNDGAAKTVTIRTNGGELIVNAPNDTVNHYGEASVVNITAVAGESYHEFGKADFTQVTSGRYVMESTGSTNALVVVDTTKVAVVENGSVAKKYENVTEAEIEDIKLGATLFAGGLGTAEEPYLIETAEHLKNIDAKYDSFSYFKVKDGVSSIDCANWPQTVALNGNFDGNGVELKNLTTALFRKVGKIETDNSAPIWIGNFVATVNSNTALVHNLINRAGVTFENIQMHGYIEAASNVGSFYRYGTGQAGGCDYTVNFVNCQSDVTIVDISGNTPGGFFGHAFPGSGNTATVNIDALSAYTGKMFGDANKGNYYMAFTYSTELYVDGEKVENNAESYDNYEKFSGGALVVGDGITVAKQPGATSMKVTIFAQYTAWENDEKVPDDSGITAIIESELFETFEDGQKVLGKVDKVQFVKGDALDADLNNGTLTITIHKKYDTYTGTVSLIVPQYDVNGSIVNVSKVVLGSVE